mmetsp:Transcript_20743/g.57860  ORF Transcript_20743/g.57860 Transcript_20743/m.57860 type:complete len:80 (+) Transcript_20743:77-316(+)
MHSCMKAEDGHAHAKGEAKMRDSPQDLHRTSLLSSQDINSSGIQATSTAQQCQPLASTQQPLPYHRQPLPCHQLPTSIS